MFLVFVDRYQTTFTPTVAAHSGPKAHGKDDEGREREEFMESVKAIVL